MKRTCCYALLVVSAIGLESAVVQAAPLGSPNCQRADANNDTDVDQDDFGVFQRCYSGDGIPADPACAG